MSQLELGNGECSLYSPKVLDLVKSMASWWSVYKMLEIGVVENISLGQIEDAFGPSSIFRRGGQNGASKYNSKK